MNISILVGIAAVTLLAPTAHAAESYEVMSGGHKWTVIPVNLEGQAPEHLVILVPEKNDRSSTTSDAIRAAKAYADQHMQICQPTESKPVNTGGWLVRLACQPPHESK